MKDMATQNQAATWPELGGFYGGQKTFARCFDQLGDPFEAYTGTFGCPKKRR